MPIQLIVGLNNPGDDYANTRHNAGAWLVNAWADKQAVSFSYQKKLQADLARVQQGELDYRLLLPHTFINLSGSSVLQALRFFDLSPDQLLIVHDDLDLPVGTVKLKWAGGHGGHNGLRDLFNKLGTQDFYRLRIGIDKPLHSDQKVGYVLQAPTKTERAIINTGIERALEIIPVLLRGDFQKAATQLHTIL